MISALFALGIGLSLTFMALSTLIHFQKIARHGVRTEGVVQEVLYDRSDKSASETIIRFSTNKAEWITERYPMSISGIKAGSKVSVIYNPEKPTEFIVASGRLKATPYLIGLGGLILTGVGLYLLVTGYERPAP